MLLPGFRHRRARLHQRVRPVRDELGDRRPRNLAARRDGLFARHRRDAGRWHPGSRRGWPEWLPRAAARSSRHGAGDRPAAERRAAAAREWGMRASRASTSASPSSGWSRRPPPPTPQSAWPKQSPPTHFAATFLERGRHAPRSGHVHLARPNPHAFIIPRWHSAKSYLTGSSGSSRRSEAVMSRAMGHPGLV